MKRSWHLIAIFALLCATSACKRLPIDPNDDGHKDTTNYRNHVLAGTSWQLSGHLDNRSSSAVPVPVHETIMLTFNTEKDADGRTGRNKYTVNWKADEKNISFSNLVSTKVAVLEDSFEPEYFRLLQSATTYRLVDNGKTLVISGDMKSLYFHAVGFWHNPPEFDGVVHFADFRVVKFQVDPFQMQKIRKIDETHLGITVQYGGGCEEHDFNLFADNIYHARGGADYVEMMITHNAHGDACKALLTKELVFDISPLLHKWQKSSVNDRLVLNFSQGLHLSNIIEFKK